MKRLIGFVTLVFGFFLSASANAHGYKNMPAISVDSLIKADPNVVIVDVRTPEEFISETGHLHNAKLIPLQQLGRRVSELQSYKDRTIVTYCLMGGRSANAAKLLSGKGFTVVNMLGGIRAWNAKGLPIVKGQAK